MSFRTGFYQDGLSDYKLNSFYLEHYSKIKFGPDNSWDINLNLRTEFIEKNEEKKPNGYNVGLGINKNMGKNWQAGINFKNENRYNVFRDLINGFIWDDDILPYSDILPENIFQSEAQLSYNYKEFLFQLKVRQMEEKNKIIYVEDLASIPNEVPLRIVNDENFLQWQEVSFGTSIRLGILQGIITYTYNNLNNISFNPANSVIADIILRYSKFENKLEGKYYTGLYGSPDNENKIGNYGNIDLYNSYQFNSHLDIRLNIFNLFNSRDQKKTDYPIDQRKIMLEFKSYF